MLMVNRIALFEKFYVLLLKEISDVIYPQYICYTSKEYEKYYNQ